MAPVSEDHAHVGRVIESDGEGALAEAKAEGSRAHWLGGPTEDDNMADPHHVAETYLHLHRQHRSTWAFEVVLRPWNERW